LSVECCRYR